MSPILLQNLLLNFYEVLNGYERQVVSFALNIMTEALVGLQIGKKSVETGIDLDLKTLKLVLLRIFEKITTDKKLRQNSVNCW